MEVVKGDLGLIAHTPEIDCDQIAMGLPPVTYIHNTQYIHMHILLIAK
jgi:hypothetical protein